VAEEGVVTIVKAWRICTKTIIALAALLLLLCGGAWPSLSVATASSATGLIDGIDKLSPTEIESRLPNSHPVNYYMYAGRLWGEGEKDKALFWLYVGQLRFRFLLSTEPHADPSGGPALFESLQATIGEPINLYASSNTKNWVDQINSALQWDQSNPNGVTSKTRYSKQWEEVRGGLVKLRDYIVAHADEIAQKRAQEGIGEVGVQNGVYVEEHKRKMPTDWPVLEASTSLDGLVGVYKGSFDLANALFSADRPKVIRATTFEISKDGASSMLVSAKRNDQELLRRTIPVRVEGGAVVFEETFKPDNYSEGMIHDTSYLRLNTAGELVIQKDSVAEGRYPNKPLPFRYVNTFWVRASRTGSQ
jgi:hypothetical protein